MKQPSALESEEQVLGAMMLDRPSCETAIGRMAETDFYSSAHRELFMQMRQMFLDGETVDPVTVMQGMKKASPEERMMVRDLAAGVTILGALPTHMRRVQDSATLRSVLHATTEIQELAFDEGAEAATVARRAEELMFAAAERRTHGKEVSWSDAMVQTLDRLEMMASQDNPITGVPTGYKCVDWRLFGLQPGHLIYVAARPGVGKTSFATGAALHAASLGRTVAFFSLEMSVGEIQQRMVCTAAEVSYSRIRRNRTNDGDWTKIVKATSDIGQYPIHTFDAGVLTPIDMAARARRIPNVDLIIVDYVQLAQWHERTSGKTEEVTLVSGALKKMARELEVPVLACAQLNRAVEDRKGPPRLSDLRESGALEQDADAVMFLHVKDDDAIARSVVNVDLIFAKNRHGETGEDKLRWEPALTRFRDLSYAEEMESRKGA